MVTKRVAGQRMDWETGPSRRDRRGASMVEYAVVLALVAGVVFFGVSFLGYAVRNSFDQVTADLARQTGDAAGSQSPESSSPQAASPSTVPWTMRFETWIAVTV